MTDDTAIEVRSDKAAHHLVDLCKMDEWQSVQLQNTPWLKAVG